MWSVALLFRSDLEQLRSAVTDARSKKSTQKNQALLPAEDELSKLSYSLSLAISEVSHILRCSLIGTWFMIQRGCLCYLKKKFLFSRLSFWNDNPGWVRSSQKAIFGDNWTRIFLRAECFSCHAPANVKALKESKALTSAGKNRYLDFVLFWSTHQLSWEWMTRPPC